MVDTWFALQAMTSADDARETVRRLLRPEAFTLSNPSRARSLIATFCMSNPLRFHAADGGGYAFLAQQIGAIDAFNPQLASSLLRPLTRWSRQDTARQALMKGQLRRIAQRSGCSTDAAEIASEARA